MNSNVQLMNYYKKDSEERFEILRKISKKDLKSLKSALYKYGVIFFKNKNL